MQSEGKNSFEWKRLKNQLLQLAILFLVLVVVSWLYSLISESLESNFQPVDWEKSFDFNLLKISSSSNLFEFLNFEFKESYEDV